MLALPLTLICDTKKSFHPSRPEVFTHKMRGVGSLRDLLAIRDGQRNDWKLLYISAVLSSCQKQERLLMLGGSKTSWSFQYDATVVLTEPRCVSLLLLISQGWDLAKSTRPIVFMVMGKTLTFPKVTLCPNLFVLSNLPLQVFSEPETVIAVRGLEDHQAPHVRQEGRWGVTYPGSEMSQGQSWHEDLRPDSQANVLSTAPACPMPQIKELVSTCPTSTLWKLQDACMIIPKRMPFISFPEKHKRRSTSEQFPTISV